MKTRREDATGYGDGWDGKLVGLAAAVMANKWKPKKMDSVAPRRAAFIGQFESISSHLNKLLKQN